MRLSSLIGILQLPCCSTLQAYTGAFLHEPGASRFCIEKQVAEFVLHCHRREGKKESKKDGVLILDDVKVISRLMWNSRSQTLIGLSMTQEQMASIGDIFQTIDEAQTSHILQFLWRDLTSNFNIIDPTFQISNVMERKYLSWQTLDLLRIDVNGFNPFCKYFLAKYPGYFISPLRITGCAVQTLFSPYKYSAGGKLDVANYSYTRAVSLVNQ
uniref:Uncharacterized protein n=1 Tax=Amphimedon queenslandica TaxID=400682 RepID=A0A1X7V7C0_AMPQE